MAEYRPDVTPGWTFTRGLTGLSDDSEGNGNRGGWKVSSGVEDRAQSPAPLVETRLRHSYGSNRLLASSEPAGLFLRVGLAGGVALAALLASSSSIAPPGCSFIVLLGSGGCRRVCRSVMEGVSCGGGEGASELAVVRPFGGGGWLGPGR